MDNYYPTKVLSVKECRRCGIIWSNDKASIDMHDRLEVIRVKIGHCPDCYEDFAAEIDRPTYRRAVPKKKK